MRLIKEGWQSYQSAVIPKDAPPVQHQECRRAFYAGVYHTLMLVAELDDDNPDAMIEAIMGEIEDHKNAIKAGKA